jgi:hypothetical protein
MTDTLTFAQRVGAKRLMLFHHDPLHSDDFLDRFCETAVQRWCELGGNADCIEMATERRELTIEAPELVG